MAAQARQGVDSTDDPDPEIAAKVPEAVRDELLDFYRVIFKGLGLIEFVDSEAVLKQVRADGPLPERLKTLPRVAAAAAAIKLKTIHGLLDISGDAAATGSGDGEPITVTFVHDSTVRLSKEARQRVSFVARKIGDHIVQGRVRKQHLGKNFLTPVVWRSNTDVAYAQGSDRRCHSLRRLLDNADFVTDHLRRSDLSMHVELRNRTASVSARPPIRTASVSARPPIRTASVSARLDAVGRRCTSGPSLTLRVLIGGVTHFVASSTMRISSSVRP